MCIRFDLSLDRYRILLTWLFLFLATSLNASGTNKLGVLAFRPKAEVMQKWQPLVDHLNDALGGDQIALEVMNYPELEQAIADKAIDFVLTNPAHYVQMTFRNGLTSPLATLIPIERGHAIRGFGGVILTLKSQTEINQLTDLSGHTVAAVFKGSLGGYQAQAMELLQVGIRIPNQVKLYETGMPHDKVVEAVLNGKAEAGFVRTGLLEGMAEEGRVNLDQLKILNQQQTADFPFLLSTRLYPEWPLAAMPHANQNLARRVAAALLALEHNGEVAPAVGIQGFSVPLDYEPVRTLLQAPRLPPYDEVPEFTVSDVVHKYGVPLILAGVMGGIILLLASRLWLLNRRLHSERQLVMHQSEERQRILSAMGDGVFGLDQACKCSFINPAALQMLGFDLGEIIGMDAHEIFHDTKQDGSKRSKGECVVFKSLKDGESRHQEDWFVRKDRVGFPVHLTVAPVLSGGKQEGVVVVFSDISERLRHEQELRIQATTDALTGLPNRRHFLNELEYELSRLKRNPDASCAVLMLDLDNFKTINDQYGHSAGDEVLKHFAQELKRVSRRVDKLGRLGGEEFSILLPDTSIDQARHMAKRICSHVAFSKLSVESTEICYTVSIGIAMMQSVDISTDAALVRADQALYQAKDAGRNCVACAEET